MVIREIKLSGHKPITNPICLINTQLIYRYRKHSPGFLQVQKKVENDDNFS